MLSEWWHDFFSGLSLELQRQSASDERTRTEAAFIEEALNLSSGSQLLDVPCGNGRHAVELAARGHQVTGVDFTSELLDEARSKASKRVIGVTWEQRDMRELPWEAAFDGVYCFGGSFGFFDDAGNFAFLDAVACALKPGGRLLIDMHAAESLFPKFQPRGWYRAGDILVVEEREYDVRNSRVNATWTLINETAGQIERKSVSVRIYTYGGMCRLLEEKGFTDCYGFGSLDGDPFEFGSERLYVVATKA